MGILTGVSLTVKRGAKLNRTFRLTDKNGTPVDLSAYVARVQVRPKVTWTTVLAFLNETGPPGPDGTTLVDGPAGEVNLFVGGDVTLGWTFDHGTFDIRMVNTGDPEDSFFLVEDGILDVKPSNTQI